LEELQKRSRFCLWDCLGHTSRHPCIHINCGVSQLDKHGKK
jgi:hypothetical protein